MLSKWPEDKPIRNLDDAQGYYRAMYCSHFFMCRESTDRYNEYRALRISRSTERKWTRDDFEEGLALLQNPLTPAEKLHSIYYHMADHVRDLEWKAGIRRLIDVMESVEGRLPRNDRVLIAEELIGERTGLNSDGLIMLAYRLGDLDLASRCADLVSLFCKTKQSLKGGPGGKSRQATALIRLKAVRKRFRI